MIARVVLLAAAATAAYALLAFGTLAAIAHGLALDD